MGAKITICFLFISLFLSCNLLTDKRSRFSFNNTDQGVELLEGKSPVLFYQKVGRSPDGEHFFNNYIHPLYSLEGDTLTEIFPADHPHHRGIFWAWHRVFVGNQFIGDSWTMDNISQDVTNVVTSQDKFSALIKTEVLWKSSLFKNGVPFLKENSSISISKVQIDYRIIDFEISLNPLFPDVYIGGSDDEKGYGGFSMRIKLPEDLIFSSDKGSVIPQNLQVEAGPWMDFSALFGNTKEKSGVTILCHPTTPNYVAPWILRKRKSMQNIVFPGKEKIKLKMNEPLILRYRLIIHKGGAKNIDIVKLQSDYSDISYTNK